MRAGSKAAASRIRLGFTPSIQMVSELMWKNGAVAELRQRLDHAAAGAEQLRALVGDDDLRPLPRRQVPLDLVGEVMHVHHRALDAGFRQPVEHVVDQRLAADRHQRLGYLAVERTHARAEPGRQHHGAARGGGDAA